MAIILTGKARIEQIKARLWKTLDNQLVQLDSGELLIAPRYLVTDNNTNPFGDNDLSDVRASHFHDIGCAYHQLIYVTKSLDFLINNGFLHPYTKENGELINVLEDLPLGWLEIRACKYLEVNKIFKQILRASGESKAKVSLMYWAVCHNLKYLFDRPHGLEKGLLFKQEYGKVPYTLS